MKNLKNYITESLSPELKNSLLKTIEDIFNNPGTNDLNWDIKLKNGLGELTASRYTIIEDFLKEIGVSDLFFIIKKCLKNTNITKTGKPIRQILSEYIKDDNKIKWEDLPEQGNIIDFISKHVFQNEGKDFLKNILNTSSREGGLQIGAGEILLLLFFQGAKKGSDIKFEDKFQVEVKGEQSRISVDRLWVNELCGKLGLDNKGFSGKTKIKNYFANASDEKIEIINEYFKDFGGLNFKDFKNDPYKFIQIASLYKYQQSEGWKYLFLVNKKGDYVILNSERNFIKNIESFLGNPKVKMYGGLNTVDKYCGFQMNLK